jgi:hypothetical protein
MEILVSKSNKLLSNIMIYIYQDVNNVYVQMSNIQSPCCISELNNFHIKLMIFI